MRKRGVLQLAGAIGLTGAAVVAAAGFAGADGGNTASREEMTRELGRRLFFDPAVGRRGRAGCAECHLPENGFSDPRPQSVDEERTLARHSQPSLDLGGEGFHWDGEFPTVRDLIDSRILPAADAKARADARFSARVVSAAKGGAESEPVKMRFGGTGGYGGGSAVDFETFVTQATPIANRLAEDGRYDDGFRLAFGDASVTPQRVGDALEAYVKSLETSENGVDRFLRGDEDALSPAARRGVELFRGKANCSQCHLLDAKDGRAVLTDGKFHDTGVGFRDGPRPTAHVTVNGRDIIVANPTGADLGRGNTTFVEADNGSFKTASLRDVARRGPYMHDASLKTLSDVVDYYNRGGTPNPHLDARIHELSLSGDERADLVAALESMTGSWRPGLGSLPDYRPEDVRVTVVDLDGKPVAGLALRVVPCGDRLVGAGSMPAPFDARTAADGTASIVYPLSTHVRIEAEGCELGLSRPIPDWVATTTLIATPKSVVSVRIHRRDAKTALPHEFAARRASITVRKGRNQSASEPPTFTLTRVRQLSDDEAVYTTPVATGRTRVAVSLSVPGSKDDFGTFEIDLTGGASETIDLARAENLHPEMPAGFLSRLAKRGIESDQDEGGDKGK